MGDVGQQVALHLGGVLDLFCHVVELLGQVAQLVVPHRVHMDGVVALRHLPRSPGESPHSRETVNAEKFLALVKKYTDFSELTPAMINEFVEKILVHQAEGKGASRTQEVEIFFNFIGKVEIPRKEIELTEEEKAALAEQERRRAKKAEYNRRYMEKKRRQWREQREQEQKPHKLPPVADEKGEKSA